MLTFRRAEACDLPDIMRVIHEAQAFMRTLNIDQWQDGYPEEAILRADIAMGQAYVIAAGQDRIAAVAVLSMQPEPAYSNINGAWRTQGSYLTIHRMAVDDMHRGAGAAREILDNALRLARENNLPALRVDTHRGNIAMRRFLEKNGFVLCGEVSYAVQAGDPLRAAYDKLL